MLLASHSSSKDETGSYVHASTPGDGNPDPQRDQQRPSHLIPKRLTEVRLETDRTPNAYYMTPFLLRPVRMIGDPSSIDLGCSPRSTDTASSGPRGRSLSSISCSQHMTFRFACSG